jgi:molybdopterin/thiamine biosynthesis adenylyltransferase/rhodanese-related sulfurtransferase/molybdopterin converting factor small subunit
MSVTMYVPTPLRAYADGRDAVDVEGSTVREALERLVARYEKLRPHLYDENGALRSFVNVYVNDEDIRYRDGMDTPLRDGDTISIVPSIAGGAGEPTTATELADAFPSLRFARSWEAQSLAPDEIRRYSRHLVMPEVGMEGQKRLKAARVLLVGAGGLGSPLALYLAAAGVGTLGLVDHDVVEFSNLQRQVLHGTKDVGRPKLASARDRILDVNPNVEVQLHETRLASANALEILREYDIVVDGTDNFPTRYLVNDACVLLGKPNVYGSIFRFEGQASVFYAAAGPCYRCLYPEPPPPGLVPSCAEGGVLGVLPGLVGAIQATETIKLVLGRGRPLIGRLLLVDALKMRFREVRLRKDPACPVCGDRPTIRELIDYEAFCGVPPEEADAGPAAGAGAVPEVDVHELKRWLDEGRPVRILDVREPGEWEIVHLDGARLIPLGELPERLHELDSAETYVVHCRTGGRSARAVALLREAGFRRVWNLRGGIRAWATEIDPSLPVY